MNGLQQTSYTSRLNSHLIPVNELANGGYEELDDLEKVEKVKKDFEAFLYARANLICKAMEKLVDGEHIATPEIYNSHSSTSTSETS